MRESGSIGQGWLEGPQAADGPLQSTESLTTTVLEGPVKNSSLVHWIRRSTVFGCQTTVRCLKQGTQAKCGMSGSPGIRIFSIGVKPPNDEFAPLNDGA